MALASSALERSDGAVLVRAGALPWLQQVVARSDVLASVAATHRLVYALRCILEACPTACDTCGCSDATSDTWLYKGKSGKSCDYVAKKPSKYCDSEDDDGTTAAEAW